MKISTVIIPAIITSTASAFVATSGTKGTITASALSMTGKSKAIPFLKQPALLDGSMIGDVGFDPFDLAENPTLLGNYREAEIRHCRIAMLGAAGWPLSELFDRSLANKFSLEAFVDDAGRAPSILNGGLGKISPYYWITILAVAAFVEAYTIQRKNTIPAEEYFPGSKLCFVVSCRGIARIGGLSVETTISKSICRCLLPAQSNLDSLPLSFKKTLDSTLWVSTRRIRQARRVFSWLKSRTDVWPCLPPLALPFRKLSPLRLSLISRPTSSNRSLWYK
jgi:hypothetical protein